MSNLTSINNHENMVVVRNLHKSFGSEHVLRGIDIRVRRGEVVMMIGRSGSGKSTILRCLIRLIEPDDGSIQIAGFEITKQGIDLPKARRHIGYVSQHFNLYPNKTAIKNVMEGLITVLKMPKAHARLKASKALEDVGLLSKLDAYPRELSGGQQQRVAIARALAMDPSVMMFDEPTSALDPELTREVLDVMKELADNGMTMIVVSHEMGFGRRVADRMLMLDEGRIIEEGPPEELVVNAREERTRKFLAQLLSWETGRVETNSSDY